MARKKLSIVDAGSPASSHCPSSLSPEFVELYHTFIDEIVALRSAATRADMEMAGSAAVAAQGEAAARTFASDAIVEKQGKAYDMFCKLAQSEQRSKSQALAALGLTGDRRGASKVRRAAHAIKANAVTTKSTDVTDWSDL